MLLQGSTGNVSITNCTFQNNSATSYYGSGAALFLYGSTGNVGITNCTFQNNSATSDGAAVLLEGSTGNVSITNCIFQNNSATNPDGVGGAVLLYGLLWYGSTGNVSITNCTFQNNSATFGGGAVWLYELTGNVSITNCTFQSNSATFDGGAICISVADLVIIDRSTFINNTAVRGAAVYASNMYSAYGISIIQIGLLTLQEVIVENNHCSCNGLGEGPFTSV